MLCPLDFIRMYWRILFVLLYPIATLPIFLVQDTKPFRCMYSFSILCAFWITEALPAPVTSLLPMILFPLLGILNSDKVAYHYMNDTNMMLLGSVVIAIAMEHTGMHVRIALYVIKCIGCSIRRLHIGLSFVTMFISMWIANTAATALMIPIVDGTLVALQNEKLITIWVEGSKKTADDEDRPSNITQCYYITIAFCSTIGGTGSIIGSGSHLAFKGLYETKFPASPGVEFAKWMALNVPLMLLSNTLVILWLQFLFLGFGRPYSKANKEYSIGKEAADTTKAIINEKIAELGPIKFCELSVGIIFVSSIVLWFFRRPGFMPGWPHYVTDVKCGDAVVAITVLLMFVLLPMQIGFIHFRDPDETKRPTMASPGILTWKIISQKMHWGMIFVLGGGFAMAAAAEESGMTKLMADILKTWLFDEKVFNLIIIGITAAIITQFLSSNVACVTILTPIVLQLCVTAKIHPMYLGLGNAMACCYSFFLPVSTPPNALVAGPGRLGAKEMMLPGFGTFIICLALLLGIYPIYAPLIWDMHSYPKWAEPVDAEST